MSSRMRTRLAIFLTLIQLTPLIRALPLPQSPNPESPPRKGPHPNWGCTFVGNSDLYGLGIRLGVYLQLLSTLLANSHLSNELKEDVRNTNAIIMVAVFVGMVSSVARGLMNGTEIFIMSTLLGSFMWAGFTPAHIGDTVLFDKEVEKSVQKKHCENFMKWRFWMWGKEKALDENTDVKTKAEESEGNRDEKEKVEEREQEKKSYFAAISRSIFGTAITLFDVWFWIHGRHKLLKNGIDDPVCVPIVFLETQIVLGSNQALLYVIMSFIAALYEVFFMAWWIYVLAPSILRFIYDVVSILVVSVCKCKTRELGRVRGEVASWYLGFATLDKKRVKMFERIRVSKKTQEHLAGLKPFLRWFGLPTGTGVIVWTSISVELTLAWNNVSNVYVLGSTGQLIPFVVGVLGLARNLHLIAVKLSEKAHLRREAKEIRIEWETGSYVYGLGRDKELRLEAARPSRRWSIDSGQADMYGKGRDSCVLSREVQSLSSLRSCTWNTN